MAGTDGLRVALIVERFEPRAGGLEHAAWQTAHALAEAGDAVTVVARRCEPSPAVETVTLPVSSAWQPLRIQRFANRASRWIDQARRTGRTDFVHAWSRVPGAHLFHTGEGSHLHYMERTYSRLGQQLRRASPRHVAQLRLESRIVAAPALHLQHVSARVGREFSARFELSESHQHLVPYGVDAERFCARGDRSCRDLQRELDPAGAAGAPRFLLAGSGWRRKGLDTALRALAAMTTRDARLWVAGNDRIQPWRALAQRLGIDERVRFLGARSDLEQVYSACDALVLPTRYDAFGMVCLEAAAAGKPIALSATAGAAELLADAALVVDEAEDHAGFAVALDTLCDPGVRTRLGDRGREIARVRTWRAQTVELRALYGRILEAGG